MLSEYILKISPKLLRFYRNFLIDKNFILNNIPENGKLLDFGCGVGIFSFEIGKCKPKLHIYSVDINKRLISLAKKYHQLKNIDYYEASIESLKEKFDCIIVIDVFHHFTLQKQKEFFNLIKKRIKKGGNVILVEPHPDNFFSYFMDTYISKDTPLNISLSEMINKIKSNGFKIKSIESKHRGLVNSYYIVFTK